MNFCRQLILIAIVSSNLCYAEPNQDALDAAQFQRRMQEEQTTLEQKQSQQDGATAIQQDAERKQLNADQRRALEQLQQRQLLLDAANPKSSATTHSQPAPQPNQLLQIERQQQDLSFDIQRQQLEFRQRFKP
jgi:hypothetical protein